MESTTAEQTNSDDQDQARRQGLPDSENKRDQAEHGDKPGQESKKQAKPRYSMASNVAYMIRLAWNGHKRVLWLCIAVAVFAVGQSLAQMFIAPAALNVIESKGSMSQLLATIGIFTLILIFLDGGYEYFKLDTMPGRISVRLSIIMAANTKRSQTSYPNLLDTRFLDYSKQADEATYGNSQPAEAVWETLTQLLTNILGFIIYLALLSGLNIYLALIAAALTVIGFFVNMKMSRWSYEHQDERASYLGAVNYATKLLSDRTYAKDLRIFGMVGWVQELWNKNFRLFRNFNKNAQTKLFVGNVVDVLLTFLRNGLAYLVLITMVIHKNITVSQFILYFSAVTGFTTWVSGILEQTFTLYRQSLDLSKVREFLEWSEIFRFSGGKPLPQAPYELCLDHVSYRYPGASADTIHDMNLIIKPQEKIAIVGLNGAGKSTLIKLVSGFLDPTEGRVLLNGQDIRQFNRREYYSLFAGVFQDFSVLPATIRENITQEVETVDKTKLWKSLEQADLAQKVQSLPHSEETQITREVYEDGTEFSGGETQRLMLARVLYRDSPVILLDEPTAALDPIAENSVYTRYNQMTEGKTAIFISHRLASTRFCSRILYLKKGKIAEEGDHDSLMALGGDYARLFTVQSKYYQEGEEKNE
ncbi:ABC transporter [Scardovia inopinata]|uniref:ABC transporter domain-containing protein n=1 Tax=Scardovia inopinata F0304 TaxID=641146 RepID=W5IJ40_SCAIO|nr:ABC transporter ATP-binding protein [Scardovia inopinata]EFG26858.1 hypothetical protein HMPREF9020_00487 [Scardovia inopinata F0304]BAR06464.1 putative ABC transporter ATP-binding component [Scardovia inopinata JCM 12537]SUV51980.1 ABC transporter [Scardovia inopinata]